MWKRATPVKRPDLKADESFKLFVNAARSVPKAEEGSPEGAAPARAGRTFLRRDDPNVIDIEVVERAEPSPSAAPEEPATPHERVSPAEQGRPEAAPVVEEVRADSTVQGAGLTARRVRPAERVAPAAPSAPVEAEPAEAQGHASAPAQAVREDAKPTSRWAGSLSGLLGRKAPRAVEPELAQVLEAMKALADDEDPSSKDPAPAPAADAPAATATGWSARFRKPTPAPPAAPQPPVEPAQGPAAPKARFSMPGFKRKPVEDVGTAAPDVASAAAAEAPASPASPTRGPRAGLNAFMGPRARAQNASSAEPLKGSVPDANEAPPAKPEKSGASGWLGRLGSKRADKAPASSGQPPASQDKATSSSEAAASRAGWLPLAMMALVAAGAAGFAVQQYRAHQQALAERTRVQSELTQVTEARRALLASSVNAYARLQATNLGLASERAALMWAPRRVVTVQLEGARQQFDVRLSPGTASRLAADSPELASLLAQQALSLRELPTPPGCTRSQPETNGDPYAVQVRFVCEAADGPGAGAGRG